MRRIVHPFQFDAMPAWYEIRVKGKLDTAWKDWFDQFEIRHSNGETLLTGPVADQAALFGLLMKIHNLGLMILSLRVLNKK